MCMDISLCEPAKRMSLKKAASSTEESHEAM